MTEILPQIAGLLCFAAFLGLLAGYALGRLPPQHGQPMWSI